MSTENPINQEIKTAPEQSKRMEKSADLLRNPIRDGEIGFDKVFIQANEITNEGNKWIINISSEDSTVILDDKWRQSLGLINSAIVPDIRKGDGEKKLVSGGTWIWIEDNQGQRFLSLMRRDAGAPVDTNCLTGPAGRCGEKLSKTSVDETNQEFIFLQTEKGGETKLLAFYRDDKEKEEVVAQKLRQVGEVFGALMKKYEETGDEKAKNDAKYLVSHVRGEENIQLLKMGEVEDKGQQLDEIIMTIDGVPIDRVRGIAYMDEKNKTLEVREVVNIKLPEGVNLPVVMDGEQWLRPTTLVAEKDLAQLKTDDLVSALRNYIEKVV
jgi:molybdopterin converting factor small subunit